MITKAIIKRIPEFQSDDNTWTVDIPIMGDNTGNSALFEAICNMSPNVYYGYKVGDVVFVEFEDDKYNIPVILGKLFIDTTSDSDPSSYATFSSLKVSGQTVLSSDTTIGNLSFKDISTAVNGALNKSEIKYKDLGEWEYEDEDWELTSEGGHWWEV